MELVTDDLPIITTRVRTVSVLPTRDSRSCRRRPALQVDQHPDETPSVTPGVRASDRAGPGRDSSPLGDFWGVTRVTKSTTQTIQRLASVANLSRRERAGASRTECRIDGVLCVP